MSDFLYRTLHEKIMFIIFASKQLLSRGEIIKGEGGRREGKRRVGGTVWFSPRALKVGRELLILQTGKWLDIGLVPNFF